MAQQSTSSVATVAVPGIQSIIARTSARAVSTTPLAAPSVGPLEKTQILSMRRADATNASSSLKTMNHLPTDAAMHVKPVRHAMRAGLST